MMCFYYSALYVERPTTVLLVCIIIMHVCICVQLIYDVLACIDCESIKVWLTKCQDDSETANYIMANTKDVSSVCVSYVIRYGISFP